ncbi:hypothetical protein IF1G_05553 [Cordyceps javanica]|uniref:Uncharacterized protein n=1 Tax=Cordyceps javanica TaxID=43265 RepID=A0A545V1Y8_9HYPO|nr:hypothetical protein IF1G_05553 [Cordyceps javanica]
MSPPPCGGFLVPLFPARTVAPARPPSSHPEASGYPLIQPVTAILNNSLWSYIRPTADRNSPTTRHEQGFQALAVPRLLPLTPLVVALPRAIYLQASVIMDADPRATTKKEGVAVPALLAVSIPAPSVMVAVPPRDDAHPKRSRPPGLVRSQFRSASPNTSRHMARRSA